MLNNGQANDNSSSEELWKDIPGYEGYYQASNKGRIRSISRTVTHLSNRCGKITERKRILKEKILKPAYSRVDKKYGHLFVNLCKNGKGKCLSVHSLVLRTFVGEPPTPGLECCHFDGNPENNCIENLRWDTHKNNHQDRIRHGTNNRGIKNGSAKLDPEKVLKARELYATNKYLMKDIASMFGVSPSIIRSAIRGKNWRDVGPVLESNFGRGLNRLRTLQKV